MAYDVGADFGFVGWEVPPPLFGEIPEVRALHVWNKDEQTA